MQHPVFFNKNVLKTFVLVVMLFLVSDFYLIYYSNQVNVFDAFINALFYDLSIVVLGLFLWYPVYFIDKNKGFVSQAIELILLAFVFVAIGVGSSWGLVSMVADFWEIENNIIQEYLIARFLIAMLVFLLFLVVYYFLISLRNEDEHKKRESELKSLLKETELNLLKSQLNPHFLFNSLNSISVLTMTNPTKAQQMIIRLSEFLRYSLRNNEELFVGLDKELDNLNRYIEIERERFGDKIHFISTIDDVALQKKLPALILQPLIENAIKYGVYESLVPVDIKLECTVEKGDLIIVLANQYDDDSVVHKGEGVGIRNTIQRMQKLYDSNNLVEIRDTEGWFLIKLVIPQFKV